MSKLLDTDLKLVTLETKTHECQIHIELRQDGDVYAKRADWNNGRWAFVGPTQPKPKTYHVGQRFTDSNITYILASVIYGKVVLINIKNGFRNGEPIQVADIHAITEDEFYKITAGEPSDFVEVIK